MTSTDPNKWLPKLKPCPFGCVGYLDARYAGSRRGFIECKKCGATGPERGSRYEAAAAWNSRAPHPEQPGPVIISKENEASPVHVTQILALIAWNETKIERECQRQFREQLVVDMLSGQLSALRELLRFRSSQAEHLQEKPEQAQQGLTGTELNSLYTYAQVAHDTGDGQGAAALRSLAARLK